MHTKTNIIFVMGVSGSGKTTIGKLLAEELGISFFDGDNYHSKANVKKMEQGHPLNDQDRQDWLKRLNALAKEQEDQGGVIACSALKSDYRKQLRKDVDSVKFIYLEGSYELISKRLSERKGHFMPAGLLRSQFDTLQVPKQALSVSIDATPSEIVSDILKKLA